MKRLAEVKDSLDIEVKQNFIDPLQNLCDKDLKEIQVPPLPRPLPAACPPSPGAGASQPCPPRVGAAQRARLPRAPARTSQP